MSASSRPGRWPPPWHKSVSPGSAPPRCAPARFDKSASERKLRGHVAVVSAHAMRRPPRSRLEAGAPRGYWDVAIVSASGGAVEPASRATPPVAKARTVPASDF